MCGRAACSLCPDDIAKACTYQKKDSEKFQKPKWREGNCYNQYKPSHNIAPTENLPVLISGSQVSNEDSERIVQPMIWGMIPPWHKGDPKSHGLTTHNCRIEHMQSSRLYSKPFNKGNRCVIVCDGFYEWQTTKERRNKQPYFIYNSQPEGVLIESPDTWSYDWSIEKGWKGPELIKMAGLYEIFKSNDGEDIFSCSVITMESTDTLSWLHHRTPAVLETDDQVSEWLDVENVHAKAALEVLSPPKLITWHPVALLVNNSRNKDIDCNKRISLSQPEVKRSASGSFMESWLKKGSPTKKDVNDGSPEEKRLKK